MSRTKYLAVLEKKFGAGEAKSLLNIIFEDVFQIRSATSNPIFPPKDLEKLATIIDRLMADEPLQYILGQADFYGCKFMVNSAVLIPRPETEELVYLILEKTRDYEKIKLLDVGTGSGCIPIILKKERPNWDISAIDISANALQVATKNAQLNHTAISFKKIDILNQSDWADLGNFDIIVSNPPYIPYAEKSLMTDSVLAHEPHLALFVANEDPLIFYQKIAEFVLAKGNKGAWLFFELNEFNASSVKHLVKNLNFREVAIHQDMQGKDRMLVARKN